jgi:hypothetical protein
MAFLLLFLRLRDEFGHERSLLGSNAIRVTPVMNINDQIREATVSHLIRWWTGEEIPRWASTTSLLHQKVASELSRRGSKGVQFLKAQARCGDIRKRSNILCALARKESYDSEVESLFTETFYNETRLEPEAALAFKELALNCFIRVGRFPLGRSEVEPLLEHENRTVSASAMVYLSHKFREEAIEILKDGLKSSNPIKRAYACTEAGFGNMNELRSEVESLLRDENDFVARSAQIACDVFIVNNEGV